MKPDGTPTVEEVCAMMEQLQSWERAQVIEKVSINARELLGYFSAEEIESATGYYVYEEEPETDEQEVIEDASSTDLISELLFRDEEELILDHLDIETDIIPYLENHDYKVISI